MFLPPELYRPIIQNVDARPDLHNLLFVSRVASHEAERLLYHAIQISPETPVSMALILHLSRCQRVAPYVRELQLSGYIPLTSWEEDDEENDKCWHALNQALCALTNLRLLTFSMGAKGPTGYSVPLPPRIFSNCTFKLQVLKFSLYRRGDFPYLDLSQVQELQLENRGKFNVVGTSFLSLRILSSSIPQLLDLGRETRHQIKAFELVSDNGAFRTKFINVTSLKLSSQLQLDDRIGIFPSLRYLYTSLAHYLAPADLDRLSLLIDQLSILNNLEKLCLVMLRRIAWPSDMVVKLFSALPSLQEVVIAMDWEAGGKCWNRNGRNPIPVSRNSIESEWKDPRWL